MPAAKQVIALLAGHLEGNSEKVRTVALQIAASEARQGHVKTAATMKRLLDSPVATVEPPAATAGPSPASLLARPRGDLEGLLTITVPQARLDAMTLTPLSMLSMRIKCGSLSDDCVNFTDISLCI